MSGPTKLEWYPPDGGVLTLETGPTVPFRLQALDGIGPVPVDILSIKSPSQAGNTALDHIVPARIIAVQFLIQAGSLTELWAKRREVAHAVKAEPVRLGADIALGVLRLYREDQDPWELEALPRSIHLPAPRGSVGLLPVDAEWVAPYPYWREIADSSAHFEEAGGGFTFGVTFFLESPENNVEQDIVNAGDVDAPIIARLYGDTTTTRIINQTTGEELEVTGQILAGQYVEISTAYGDKRIELVAADGTRTSIMDRLNLAKADFWSLRPGTNSIRYEASVNVSGRADLYWRERFAGV